MVPRPYLASALIAACALGCPAYAAPDNTLGVALFGISVAPGTGPGATDRFSASGVTASAHISTGTIIVSFERDVSNCIYGGIGFSPDPMIDSVTVVDASPVPDRPDQVKVRTYSGTGLLDERRFYLTVFCPE
jgi:hypothetical protein